LTIAILTIARRSHVTGRVNLQARQQGVGINDDIELKCVTCGIDNRRHLGLPDFVRARDRTTGQD
jgi:hypothetical protein